MCTIGFLLLGTICFLLMGTKGVLLMGTKGVLIIGLKSSTHGDQRGSYKDSWRLQVFYAWGR